MRAAEAQSGTPGATSFVDLFHTKYIICMPYTIYGIHRDAAKGIYLLALCIFYRYDVCAHKYILGVHNGINVVRGRSI